jgi:hypothetical protein
MPLQKEIAIKAVFEPTGKSLEGALNGIANTLRASADIGIDSGQINFNRHKGERILKAQIVLNEGTPEEKIERLKDFLRNEVSGAKSALVEVQNHAPHAHLRR